jgi:hypothetical protein
VTPGSGDLGWGRKIKIRIRDVHIYESLEAIFGLKILEFFYADLDLKSGNLLDPG